MYSIKNVQQSIKIPDEYPPIYRQEIAQAIVEYLRERTKKGLGKDLSKFPGQYTKGYQNSIDFAAGNKSKGKINLTLSGDMLSAMELVSHKKGEVTVGYKKGNEEAPKAEGNIIGSYGGAPKKSKARDFLAISNKEVLKILKDFPLEKISDRTKEQLEISQEERARRLKKVGAKDE